MARNQLRVQDIDLNQLDLDFYLALHQSVHTHRCQPIYPCIIPWIKQSKSMKMIAELSLITAACAGPPDLISQLIDPVVDPWLDRETCYNLIPVPESYTGPRLSFPLSVSDTNALLGAFKEQQV